MNDTNDTNKVKLNQLSNDEQVEAMSLYYSGLYHIKEICDWFGVGYDIIHKLITFWERQGGYPVWKKYKRIRFI